MNLSRIRSLHVIIIGSVVCVIVGVGLFFVLIKPTKAKIAQTQSRYDASKQVADQEFSARNDRDGALEEARKAQDDYNYFQKTKMPNIDFSDRGQGMVALWREQSITLGPLIQKWPSRTGVRLISPVSVPAPPVNPNTLQTELIQIEMGDMQVQGSFKKILDHLRSWNYFNRLVKIDLPSLTGPSPTMIGQYKLTIYIFPTGKVGPPIALAGQTGAEGAMGMPGMPTPGMPYSSMPTPGMPYPSPTGNVRVPGSMPAGMPTQ